MRRRGVSQRFPLRARSLGRLRAPRFLLPLRGALALLALGVLAATIFWLQIPDVSILRDQYPVVIAAAKKGVPPTIRIQKKRPASWVSLGSISQQAVGAILVSEDWAFYSHEGFDTNQIIEAAKEDWDKGHFKRGASTITQQVVRNVFLEKEKTLWRKLKEIVLAVRLERSLSKRRILEIYLNVAEWGRGFHGIKAASAIYFDKAPRDLNAREGAFLAMLLPSPKRYSQSFRDRQLTRYARRTINSILDKMVQARYLSADDRDFEKIRRLAFEETDTIRDEPSSDESPAEDPAEDNEDLLPST